MDNFDKFLEDELSQDKLFQDKLGEINENDFEFKESSWERFHKDWQTEDMVKKGGISLWLKRNAMAAAIVLLLLTSNVFFAQQLMTTRSDVKQLTSTIEELTTNVVACKESATAAQSELTIIKESYQKAIDEITVLHTNTNSNINSNFTKKQQSALQIPTYPNNKENATLNDGQQNNGWTNTVDVNNNSTSKPTIEQQNQSSNNGINNDNGRNVENKTNTEFPNKTVTSDNLNNDSNGRSNGNSTVNSDNSTTAIIDKTIDETVDKSAIERLKQLNFVLNNVDKANSEWWNVPKTPNDKVHQETSLGTKAILALEAAKPSDYHVGFHTNIAAIPSVKGVLPALATTVGVEGSTLFFNRLRLNVGVDFWNQIYNFDGIEMLSDDKVSILTDNLSVLYPTDIQDELSKVEASIKGLDIPITAQIMLRPNQKWNPYIGFGVVGRYYHAYKQDYYFNDYDNVGYRYEVKDLGNIRSFDFSMLKSQFGVDYRINKKWLFNAELNYIHSYRSQIFGIANVQQFGLELGVKYTF